MIHSLTLCDSFHVNHSCIEALEMKLSVISNTTREDLTFEASPNEQDVLREAHSSLAAAFQKHAKGLLSLWKYLSSLKRP